jgi:hypothetical protein
MQCSVQEMVDFFRQQEHCDNWKESASQTDRKGKYQGGLDEAVLSLNFLDSMLNTNTQYILGPLKTASNPKLTTKYPYT